MKPNFSKALALLAVLAFSLSQAVPAQAAGATLAALHSVAGQVYVSPGIAGFFKALLSLLQ
jgi:hypothetical protein